MDVDVDEVAAVEPPTATEVEARAGAAYTDGDLEGAVAAWEQLHARHLATGEHVEAARAAAMVAMYLMMDTGLMAPVRGWLGRCERLLADQGETPVHALLAMTRAYERFMCGDMALAGRWAERAVLLGDRHGVPPAATLGRVAAARVRIFEGDVDAGLAALDEVAVVLMSGEVDPLTTGMVYCELVCAMQGLTEYDRAAEWTAAMDAWRTRGDFFGGINGRCRVHRAELLRLRGHCEDAEVEALHACEELQPWMRREYGWPLTELGTIRLRRGDLDGAEEAFRAAHTRGWDPQPGWALVRFARGDLDGAAAMLRDALDHPRHVPSKERPPLVGLSRAPLLEAQVQVAAARGDLDTARAATEELATVADRYGSAALVAAATLARGRVARAEGDTEAATDACRQAVDRWCDLGLPYEAAVARLALAEALRDAGEDPLATMQLEAAVRGLDEIGAVRLRDDARARLDHGSDRSTRPASTGGTGDATAPTEATFRLDGDSRVVAFDGHEVVLRDLKGMRLLARLLAEPGREFHVLDLDAAVEGVPVVPGSDTGPILDAQAREAYRRRLVEVEEDLEDAEAMRDDERAALARRDRDFLVDELSRAFGLAGRPRVGGSDSERARSTVTRAIRYATARVAEHHRSLGAHLDRTVRTGTYCAYEPDPRAPITWAT